MYSITKRNSQSHIVSFVSVITSVSQNHRNGFVCARRVLLVNGLMVSLVLLHNPNAPGVGACMIFLFGCILS